ncbi:L domain-containing protein [Chloropicon primus]|uniref:L domain-containing protein n=1 Tax=Chloropicon primus TaxID=1764295 RepID=A0A5B8MHN3_9CHLO|nr:L domain-containing protein [Chloropicon primus]UPQ98087.1 L domain-containing protein [Chloropicon primus]|mmetsp:Transcript_13043/g.36590  ORF Transcript_13043/g.36590 Transcript_13043/m.36590 type:complete len:223 (+) Transcript_13043:373-1041(+)|eukprot:QDZ18880.1 L domain-containing protein [Chloropicon primus]
MVSRVAGRLSTELILSSRQYMNACDEYEIDLRGNKIGVIENLGGTENQFDSIDLSENEIVKLEGFPLLPRLKTLTLNNNRISRISKNLEASIPNLETLVLTGNRINNLTDIRNLRGLSKLKRLVVINNGITKIPQYRLHILKQVPQLRMIDFAKMKESDRKLSETMNGDDIDAKMLKDTAAPMEDVQTSPQKPNIAAIKAAIASAQTIEEVQKLEAALQSSS